MRVVGIGIDIVEIGRIRIILDQPNCDALDAWFTPTEQVTLDNNLYRFAEGIALKEAVAKALGTGFQDDVTWMDIQITWNSLGPPNIKLSCGASKAASLLGINRWRICTSHCRSLAVAHAVAVAEP